MALPTYSAGCVRVAFMGIPLDGLAPDSFITVSRNTETTDTEVGADGQVSISKSPDLTGTCSIVLQQQSIANKILAGILSQQDASCEIIAGDISVYDPSGSMLAVMKNCHIQNTPEIDLGITATGKTRTWVFFVEKLIYAASPSGSGLTGGNLSYVTGQLGGIGF